jgi:exodeoxyribonuclease V gamma subunit
MLEAWRAEQARFPHPTERQSVRLQTGDVVLEDWMDHLRQGPGCPDAGGDHPAHGAAAWLELQPGKLLEKASKPKARIDKLLAPWVRSLTMAASGLVAQGVIVGRDGVIDIAPMAQEEAQATLNMLLSVWLQGMNAPLPLPLKTALALLKDANPRQTYEGGYMTSAEADEPCLARMFPDFEALTMDGVFEPLAEQVYAPLLAWAEGHVRARSHAAAPVLEEVAP